ncbi:phosphoglycolate phosphatase [Marinobacter zhanjiangensis]|uniref:Phosphoglycolate phosphatase n=1 Tax=Marinobacter zhanjiangensis TaxID=578215 RepID=A0ABQ3AJA4_9GAMM|nr:phosphoglycolate phosphatase [Marinobacter zhanjiangensis]GGY58125.1 phosphoglycolate phosphatase 1 [Marinobacter zhanjiangensis]
MDEPRRNFTSLWPGVALFDLDGTLVDSAPDLAAAVDQMLESLGRPPAGPDRVRQWVGNGAQVLVRRALTGQVEWESAAPLDEVLFNDASSRFYQSYESLNGSHSTVFDGVEACLQRLFENGCRMAVVTNKPERFVRPLLESMGLEHWFETIVGGDTLPVKKPDAEPLLTAMQKLDGNPGTTVMIGDSAADATAARNAGLPSVLVRYGYNYGSSVDELGADVVVDSLTELL